MSQFVITALDTQSGSRKAVYYAADVSAVNRNLPRLQKKYAHFSDWQIDRYTQEA